MKFDEEEAKLVDDPICFVKMVMMMMTIYRGQIYPCCNSMLVVLKREFYCIFLSKAALLPGIFCTTSTHMPGDSYCRQFSPLLLWSLTKVLCLLSTGTLFCSFIWWQQSKNIVRWCMHRAAGEETAFKQSPMMFTSCSNAFRLMGCPCSVPLCGTGWRRGKSVLTCLSPPTSMSWCSSLCCLPLPC